MNEIIWTLNSNDGHLDDLLYYIRSQCSEMLDEANIDFVYHLPTLIPKRMVSSEQKRNLYLVVKESVHNAIKHSKANTVHLRIEIDSLLIISITDNGTGFSTTQTNLNGNGLNNFKKRMDALSGTFAIEAGQNGTTVIFKIPIT
jgi:signal transduction histidine kinase